MTWACREVEEGKTGYLESMREVGSNLLFIRRVVLISSPSLLLTSIRFLISIVSIVLSVCLTYVLGNRSKVVNRRGGFTLVFTVQQERNNFY